MTEQIFVGREREIAFLQTHLTRALSGQGHIVLVQGEAGLGKTALLQEFARQAQAQHPSVLVAVGDCSAQTGAGEPYLPFREAISLLTGDFEAKLAQGRITVENVSRLQKALAYTGLVLLEVAPDLIEVFVPGGRIISKAGVKVGGKLGKAVVGQTPVQTRLKDITAAKNALLEAGRTPMDQEHIFEQCASFLVKLAAKQPLLITLDDLQWADASSLSLLYHLARRIGGSPILVVGAYRPEELAQGRTGEIHPLQKVEAELSRLLGEITVELDQADPAQSRWFVDAYVDSEPNRLGEQFRAALATHTGGHPLFVVELLRDLQARGDLVKDAAGRWIEPASLNWNKLPARIDGVVRARIGRLDQEQRETLTVASVAGLHFIAELVAQLRAVDARAMVRTLSEDLGRTQQLVEAEGIQRIDSRRLSSYRFRQHLYQSYIYQQLDEVERSYLHEDMATALETLYAGNLDEIAVQLAWHFEVAGRSEAAVRYLRRAAELATAAYAQEEALKHTNRALELTAPTDRATRLELLLVREAVYDWQGQRSLQAADLQTLAELARAQNDLQVQARVRLRQANYQRLTGHYPQALEHAQAAVDLAGQAGDRLLEASGYALWGRILLHTSQEGEAREWLELAGELAGELGAPALEALSLYDLGHTYLVRDQAEEARGYYQQALALYTQSGDRRGQINCLLMLGTVQQQLGAYGEAVETYQEGLAACRPLGWRHGESFLLANLGNTWFAVADYEQAGQRHQEALAICRMVDDRQGEATSLDTLGLVAQLQGDLSTARANYDQALHIQRAIGYPRGEAFTLTHLGHCLLASGDPAAAAEAFQNALDIRRRLSADNPAAVDALAGLAQAALANGDTTMALAHAQEVARTLETHGAQGIEFPSLACVIAGEVLAAAGERQQAAQVLSRGRAALLAQAATIRDETLRARFLQADPHNRRLLEIAP